MLAKQFFHTKEHIDEFYFLLQLPGVPTTSRRVMFSNDTKRRQGRGRFPRVSSILDTVVVISRTERGASLEQTRAKADNRGVIIIHVAPGDHR